MVIILRGCSGTGKSTWTRNEGESYGKTQVFSADHFFEDGSGAYNFDASKLGAAHGWCLKHFSQVLQMEDILPKEEQTTLIVDNTNTTKEDIAPYAALALAYGRELKVVTLLCDPKVAHARNAHGVPFKTVKAQYERLVRSAGKLPPRWPEVVVELQDGGY